MVDNTDEFIAAILVYSTLIGCMTKRNVLSVQSSFTQVFKSNTTLGVFMPSNYILCLVVFHNRPLKRKPAYCSRQHVSGKSDGFSYAIHPVRMPSAQGRRIAAVARRSPSQRLDSESTLEQASPVIATTVYHGMSPLSALSGFSAFARNSSTRSAVISTFERFCPSFSHDA